MSNPTILETIDPEISERLVSRRQAIAKGATASGAVIAGLKMASVPLAIAALSRDVFAQGGTPAAVTQVLNFALKLEIFENEFYKAVLGTGNSTATNNAFAPVRALALGNPAAIGTITQIQIHEEAHVNFLLASGATDNLNLRNRAERFDFTGGRGTGTGPFAAATTDLAFLLATAQGAEDTGVRAYKGGAGILMSNPPVLEAALRIHSVEARHAARIRRIRRLANANANDFVRYSGTVRGGGAAAAGYTGTLSQPVINAFAAIYAGEDLATQAGVNIAGLPGVTGGANAATEAFDEPLTPAQVIAIVQPFFIDTFVF